MGDMEKPSLTPLYAMGTFHVCMRGGVGEYIRFLYRDEDLYYWGMRELEKEEEIIKNNMQSLLDEETVYFNDMKTRPIVEEAYISVPRKGFVIYTFIVNFRAIIRPGKNIYLNIYEETVADYDYEVIWRFPRAAREIKAELGVPVHIKNNTLFFRVKKGTRVGGREKISFVI